MSLVQGKLLPFVKKALRESEAAKGSAAEKQHLASRLFIYNCVLSVLCSATIQSEKEGTEIVNTLLASLTGMPEISYGYVTERLMYHIESSSDQNAALFGMFPRLLDLVSKLTKLVGGEDHKLKDGIAYKMEIISRVCGLDWTTPIALNVLKNFKDIPMAPVELKSLVKKSSKFLSSLDAEDLPSFVYLLLLLASKGERTRILSAVIQCFNNLDMNADHRNAAKVSQLRSNEGTVFVHFDLAMKRDPKLVSDLIKMMKQHTFEFTPFSTALALSISQSQRNSKVEEQVLDILRLRVLNSFKAISAVSEDSLLREFQNADFASETAKSEKTFLSVVEFSKAGWDHCISGLLQFGVLLMDLHGALDVTSAAHLAAQLGHKILLECFKTHESVRQAVLEQVFARVVTKGDTSPLFIQLLSEIVRSSVHSVLDNIQKIREAVESISQLTPEIASELLFALEPIVHLNPAFQDHVVLVLRKAMFNRELQAKKIAVSGFLQLLKGAKLSGTDAALMKQQQFALDVLGFLKRCLSHQYEIRELLYKGLADIYAANPDVREWVLAPLISQLSIYYAAEAPYPVFALKKCLELKNSKVTLNEPLSQLIQAVSSCMVVSKGVNTPSITRAKAMLDNCIHRVMKSEYEEFELDKSTEYASGTPEGIYNQEMAGILMSAAEALMEYRISGGYASDEEEAKLMESLQKIFKFNTDLKALIREKITVKGKKGKKVDATVDEDNDEDGEPKSTTAAKGALRRKTVLSRPSTLSKHCIADFVSFVCRAPTTEEPEALRASAIFRQYIMSVCLAQLKEMNNTRKSSPMNVVKENRRICIQLAPVLWKEFNTNWKEAAKRETKKEGKVLPLLAVECYYESLKYVCEIGQVDLKKLGRFLTNSLKYISIEGETEDQLTQRTLTKDPKIQIHSYVHSLGTVIVELLESEVFKEAEWLIEAVARLHRYLPPRELSEHIDWMDQIAISESTNVPFVKTFLGCFWPMVLKTRQGLTSITQFARDIRRIFGDASITDTEPPPATRYAIVNEKTAVAVSSLLLDLLDDQVAQVEFVFQTLKNRDDDLDVENDDESSVSEAAPLRDKVYIRLTAIAESFSELAATSLRGPANDHVIRSWIKFSKLLHVVVTDLISKKSKPGDAFVQLLEIIGSKFISNIYAYLLYYSSPDGDNQIHTVTKIAKEAKQIPNLIMWLEKFDADIIKLSSTTAMPLMKYLKRSTARDFKIQTDKIADLKVKNETSIQQKAAETASKKKRKQPADGSRVEEGGEESMAVDGETTTAAESGASKSKRKK